MRYLIGIDEAGRGPLAGPVSVGAVMVAKSFDFSVVENVRDSKKLSAKRREEVYAHLDVLKQEGAIHFAQAFSSSTYIDRFGIVPAVKRALAECLEKLNADPSQCELRLDGALSAPESFTRQTSIIRGDDLEPVISAASIVAKVERDRLMQKLAEKYPLYNFAKHKGYGTAEHIALIRTHGLSDIHRKSFCSGIRA